MEFQSSSFQSLGGWLGRVVRLDLTVFDDVRDDAGATVPALAVMVVASFLAGLGTWLWALAEDVYDKGDVFIKATIIGSILQVGAWFLWVYIVAMVLSRGYGASADVNKLVRTMGLAFAPMAITVLMVVTVLAVPFAVLALGFTLLLSQIAIVSATDAEPRHALRANVVGFAAFAIVLGILSNIGEEGGLLGGFAPGLFFFSFDF
jgi:hypothetical protein